MAVLSAALLVTACGASHPNPEGEAHEVLETSIDQPIDPLPSDVAFDARRAALGEALFKNPLISGDGKVSCSGCHSASHALADEKPRSFVAGRPESPVNSPTMYNVRFLYKLAWGARFDSLETHLDALLKNPKVMASSWDGAARRLTAQPGQPERFSAVFKDGLTPANVREALLEYERSLVTPDAPFDRFLRGELHAISQQAKQGYAQFKSYGCASCHQGIAVGGNMLQRFGVMRDYFADRGNVGPADFGRYSLTHREEDRFVFRVPSLRNVALTAPYFHDGSAKTLEEAVTVMARYQLGREIELPHRDAIVAFLRSLTGEYRGKPP
jgi:cytochrome c peroxidase